MLRISFLFLFFAALLSACNSNNQSASSVSTEQGGMQSFGEKITADGALSYDDFLKKMAVSDSLETKVVGTVASVCQMKGCWMNIVSTQPNNPEMFVKFKDYGFFMPKDISGQKVIMRGNAYREVTSVDELRHYAEDEGKSKEEIAKITEPIEELKFMADGVLLVKE